MRRNFTAVGPTHQCPVHGCPERVGDKFLMCNTHWRMVPRKLQGDVWGAWNGGKPHPGHGAACDRATEAVNEKLKTEA